MYELPHTLGDVLGRIAEARRVDAAFRADIELFNRRARILGTDNYMSYARQIRRVGKLWPYRPTGFRSARFCVTDPSLPEKVPGAAWLYLFHGAGQYREAALRLIPAQMPSSFHLYALIYRQNDWVAEVRTAAREAFGRIDGSASALQIAIASLPLWADVPNWGRGTSELVLKLLRDPPVFEDAVRQLGREASKRGLGALRQMLRYKDIDQYLATLATEAHSPTIRRLALTTLWRGEARILAGYRQVWVDKSLGRSRPEPVFDIRPLTVEVEAGPLCLAALEDRAVHVRAAALDGLMARVATDVIPAEQLNAMADGPVYRLAWRADYIRRQRTGT